MSSLINSIEKLKGRENYGSWKVEMCAALRIEKLWTDVIAMKTKDDKGNFVSVESEKDEAALARITLCVDKTLYSYIRTATKAKEAWEALEKAFDDSGLLRRVMLLQDLGSCRLVDFESPSAYIDKLITTAQKLNDLKFTVTDEWLGSLLLAGLPMPDYRPMIMGMENSGVEITAEFVKCRILQDVSATSSMSESALFAKKANKKKIKCYKCKAYGHYANKCDSAKSKESTSKSDKNEARGQKPKPSGEKRTFLTAVSTSTSSWYLDSGSSCHITNSEAHLLDPKPSDVTTIATADNNNMLVKKQGRVELQVEAKGSFFEIDVKDTLYVPGAAANLLSVSRIVKNGNKVVFSKHGAKVYDENGIFFASAVLENSIYRLNVIPAHPSSFLAAVGTDLWHRRLGHLNQKGIEYLKENALGITGDTKMSKICGVCIQGKHARAPFRNSAKRADEVLGVVHSDLCCMETVSIGGAKYMLTCLDDHSRYVHIYTLKEKSQVPDKLKEFCALVENQTNQRIKIFRSDGGTEFCNSQMDRYFKSRGVVHQKSTRYTPQQNGRAERVQRTLVEKGRSMLADAGLGKEYWGFAVLAAAYLYNRSPSRVLGGRTPFEFWTGEKPDLSNLRIFGCQAWVQVPKQRRKKWDEKSVKLIFVGYPEDYKAYRFIDPKTKSLVVSRDVVFIEGLESNEIAENAESPRGDEPITLPCPVDLSPLDDQKSLEGVEETLPGSPSKEEPVKEEYEEDDPSLVPLPDCSDDEDFYGWDDGAIPDEDQEHESQVRRSERVPKPKKFPDFVSYVAYHTRLVGDEPVSYAQALASPDAASWERAMDDEFSSLKKNETFSVVKLPAGKKPLSTRWVYRIKEQEDGARKFKARLVIRGCSQAPGTDYHETFSPVVRHASLRYLFSLAAEMDLDISHHDVCTAFLYGHLEEEIYVTPPANLLSEKGKVWRLHCAVYGLKQAGRCFYEKISSVLESFGLRRSRSDPCVFVHNAQDGKLTVLAIWVDDVLLFSNDPQMQMKVESGLEEHFEMKNLGEIRKFLGMNITRDRAARTLWIDQSDYVLSVLDRFGMTQCNKVSTPLEVNLDYLKVQDGAQLFDPKVPYQEAVGCLLYLSQVSRPDICFAVNMMSRFNQCYQQQHWQALKRIFRYLKGTATLKLQYKKTISNSELVAYCDSDWGSTMTQRRSISGVCVVYNGSPVSWFSRRQPTVAMSTVDAEYMALGHCVQEVLWFWSLVSEIFPNRKLLDPIKVFCNNTGAIKTSKNDSVSNRTKHIDIRFHFVKDHVKKKNVNILHIPSGEMLADALTKSLSGAKHQYFVDRILVV